MSLEIVKVDGARPYPPRVSEFTQTFWQALADGRLITTRGVEDGRLTFPPKPFCPHSWSDRVEWVELSGRGRLYSQTVVHAAPAAFAAEAPYRVGIVDLDEGLRIATRILDDGAAPVLDGPVEIVVLAYDDGPLFAARPL
ncbi:MAG: OB-fold domain-containing protein [Alphaproteobacteria bacterium]|jgi:hypothetical protein|nr:OB-fold domain-containing protein [Alphaproteobacteria bacterium]MDP6564777.1 OB-fold domain-containing protein [Alphaproteobacteria bacterium]MDP6814126.1 OB-fold domain-containing protein [Alphaproteobacteria bacterium]